jgi:hypothetical protein
LNAKAVIFCISPNPFCDKKLKNQKCGEDETGSVKKRMIAMLPSIEREIFFLSGKTLYAIRRNKGRRKTKDNFIYKDIK